MKSQHLCFPEQNLARQHSGKACKEVYEFLDAIIIDRLWFLEMGEAVFPKGEAPGRMTTFQWLDLGQELHKYNNLS